MNGLELYSPQYKITNRNLIEPFADITLTTKINNDYGVVDVNFKGGLNQTKSTKYFLRNNFDLIEYKEISTSLTPFNSTETYYCKDNNGDYIKQIGITSFDPYSTYYIKRYITDSRGFNILEILKSVF